MDEDGSNIRLTYIEDEQLLVFPQIAKKRMCPIRECAPLSPRVLCPYFTLQVSEHLDQRCALGTKSNFAKNAT